MATWGAFADADPELASNALALLTQFGPGLGFLATVRADGGPRLHPICPVVADGQLWAFIIEASPKCADLRRDGRFALHAFPPEAVDDELAITGTAAEVTEAAPGDVVGRADGTPWWLVVKGADWRHPGGPRSGIGDRPVSVVIG